MPDEIPFLVADRFPGVSPADVPEWDAEMVEAALQRISIEGRVDREAKEKAAREAARNRTGGGWLGEDFPELA